ncbi:uncharacterized protein LOC118426168 [Branchiostoma floridae]|uniref:Uncharacterized protein LOC118426168 n=1 Tax=Branchiostoma floridae TaxID=7739 RepID=A0A9J7LYZ4_BRAFL|nr:uncharacterized protein LOC118426168 [Branchiostoma floridae]
MASLLVPALLGLMACCCVVTGQTTTYGGYGGSGSGEVPTTPDGPITTIGTTTDVVLTTTTVATTTEETTSESGGSGSGSGEEPTTAASSTSSNTATPADLSSSCFACSADNTADVNDPCLVGPMMAMSQPCPVGVCITILREDTNGTILLFERRCHIAACTGDNSDGVFSSTAGGDTEYQKCCDDAANCNTISYNELRGTATRAVTCTSMAAVLISVITLLAL